MINYIAANQMPTQPIRNIPFNPGNQHKAREIIVEAKIKEINHTTQECPRKRQASGVLSYSSSDHEYHTSYESLCYDNEWRNRVFENGE